MTQGVLFRQSHTGLDATAVSNKNVSNLKEYAVCEISPLVRLSFLHATNVTATTTMKKLTGLGRQNK